MGYEMEDIAKSLDKLQETVSDHKEDTMGDIAGLLALMQGNKGMDLPGLLALCKEKGYDRGWGGEGMFLFVFLILFLFAGGGWNGLNRAQQNDFATMAGNNCQSIIGPRLQECMHLFLALDDFITELHGMLNDEENAEYKKWKVGLES